MRLSRKAGLLACGARWEKYTYFPELYMDLVGYSVGDWIQTDGGTGRLEMNGYTNYSIVLWSTLGYDYSHYNKYVPTYSGSKRVTRTNPGTVYHNRYGYGARNVYITRTTLNSDGSWVENSALITNNYTNQRYVEEVGDCVGVVICAEDEYPDAASGYTYVGVSGDYIIMAAPSGSKYAYLKAE
jgi:hypothetical protein